jgi:DNA methylase
MATDETKSLDALVPDRANRRLHPQRNQEMVEASLRSVGTGRSIVIDEDDVILAGNGVTAAALAAGITTVRVVESSGDELIAVRRRGLTAEQKRALALYDNRTAELAEWDIDGLRSDVDAGLELQPFWTHEEESALLAKHLRAGHTDPDETPAVRATAIQRGDLFALGPHRLLCGDSTDAADVARVVGSEKAALCLTDPPYGIGLDYGGFADTVEAVTDLATRWLPIARQHAEVVVFSPGVTRQWLYPAPDWVLCWFYGGGQLRSPWGFNCWQPFLAYGPDPSLARGHGCRPDAVDSNTPANAQDVDHPCPKPVALWLWLLERLTFETDALVLDTFAGGGTGLIAAEQFRRRFFGVELSPSYVQVTIDRWEAFTGQRAEQVG